jgi:Arc/MetJ-type ribon-helix-helix transcriptional regulator
MATLTVSLPDDTVKYLEEKVRQGGHASVDAYLGAVLYEIRLIEAKKKFEAKIQEAIDSGPAVPVTRETWESLRREVFEQLEAERNAR